MVRLPADCCLKSLHNGEAALGEVDGISSRVALLSEIGDDCSGIAAFECSHFHLLSVNDLLLVLAGQLSWTEDRCDALAVTGTDDVTIPDVDDGDALPQ